MSEQNLKKSTLRNLETTLKVKCTYSIPDLTGSKTMPLIRSDTDTVSGAM